MISQIVELPDQLDLLRLAGEAGGFNVFLCFKSNGPARQLIGGEWWAKQLALCVLKHATTFGRQIVLYQASPDAEMFWQTIGSVPIELENTTHILDGKQSLDWAIADLALECHFAVSLIDADITKMNRS